MDKTIKLSLMLSFLFLFSSQATADDSSFSKSGEKLSMGISNIATGFVELPKNIILKSEQEGVFYGVTVGLAAGIMHSVGRTAMGILDVVTFIIPIHQLVRVLSGKILTGRQLTVMKLLIGDYTIKGLHFWS